MSKVIDITDKLDFGGNPRIKIKDIEYEVNADASAMLKIMGILTEKKEPGPEEVLKMYDLLFSDSERKKIEKLKLSFKDFQTFIFSAISLITGDTAQGEQ